MTCPHFYGFSAKIYKWGPRPQMVNQSLLYWHAHEVISSTILIPVVLWYQLAEPATQVGLRNTGFLWLLYRDETMQTMNWFKIQMHGDLHQLKKKKRKRNCNASEEYLKIASEDSKQFRFAVYTQGLQTRDNTTCCKSSLDVITLLCYAQRFDI